MGGLSFARMANVACSTKRPPALSSGVRGGPVTYLSNLKCTPLDSVSAEIAMRPELQTPHTLRQTFIKSDDIKPGDVLVVSGSEYPIKAVDPISWRGVTCSHLFLEVLQR